MPSDMQPPLSLAKTRDEYILIVAPMPQLGGLPATAWQEEQIRRRLEEFRALPRTVDSFEP